MKRIIISALKWLGISIVIALALCLITPIFGLSDDYLIIKK